MTVKIIILGIIFCLDLKDWCIPSGCNPRCRYTTHKLAALRKTNSVTKLEGTMRFSNEKNDKNRSHKKSANKVMIEMITN
jgi:hypothetical protein